MSCLLTWNSIKIRFWCGFHTRQFWPIYYRRVCMSYCGGFKLWQAHYFIPHDAWDVISVWSLTFWRNEPNLTQNCLDKNASIFLSPLHMQKCRPDFAAEWVNTTRLIVTRRATFYCSNQIWTTCMNQTCNVVHFEKQSQAFQRGERITCVGLLSISNSQGPTQTERTTTHTHTHTQHHIDTHIFAHQSRDVDSTKMTVRTKSKWSLNHNEVYKHTRTYLSK
jgi:hypothetical protein